MLDFVKADNGCHSFCHDNIQVLIQSHLFSLHGMPEMIFFMEIDRPFSSFVDYCCFSFLLSNFFAQIYSPIDALTSSNFTCFLTCNYYRFCKCTNVVTAV